MPMVVGVHASNSVHEVVVGENAMYENCAAVPYIGGVDR